MQQTPKVTVTILERWSGVAVQDLQKSKGWDIDARLLMYAMGLQQAAELAL
jgi:hypothetical protein